MFPRWNWLSFVCRPLYPPRVPLQTDCSQEVAVAVPRSSLAISSPPVLSPAKVLPLLPPPWSFHFILLSSQARRPLTPFSFTLISSTLFFSLFRPPVLSSHLPPFFFPHSSDPLVFPPLPYSFSFPLVFPSLLWRLNLSLSSECPWAEGGYCWCRSRRSFWGADNSPAMLPLSICACFTWQTVYFSSIFNFFKLRTESDM